MPRSKIKSLPEFGSLDTLVKFFDENDLGDYWDILPEATFDVALKRRRHLVALDERVASKLSEVARSKKVSSEKLLNSWLRERLRMAS
ncbi:MAG: BrnA antitoxin family protein [Acidobacteriota bacterium]|nr:BrnA antitoxin family protein [Acidobacteriota bacterium]